MFTTQNSTQLPFLGPADVYCWDRVVVYVNRYWIYVSYDIHIEEGTTLGESTILSNVDQLIDLSVKNGITIQFVDIVSPSYMNGSPRWKMEPLHQIWRSFSAKDQNKRIYFFQINNGACYQDGNDEFQEDTFDEKKLIFTSPDSANFNNAQP